MTSNAGEANSLPIHQQVTIANLNDANAKSVALLIQHMTLFVFHLYRHTVQVRMVNSPQFRMAHRRRDCYRHDARSNIDPARFVGSAFAVRTESRYGDEEPLLLREMVLENDQVTDSRLTLFHLSADLLPIYFHRPAHRQPDIADDAAVVPPVVPGVGIASLG